jgi:6-phosphogluconolactonase
MGIKHLLCITLAFWAAIAVTHALVVRLPDGRRAHILKNDVAVADFLVERIEELANAAIAKKGAFSMSVGSGTTVQPLAFLAGRVDFSKVHLFFGNERTEGDAAGKCADGGGDVFAALVGLNVHRVPFGPAEEAAAEYEAAMRAMPREIVGVCDRSGKEMPSLDLCLLGSGADGHCASLYPHSAQVVCSPGCDRVYLPAEGKGGITLSIDAINSAHNVLISAGKTAQSDMVRKSLGWSNAATNHALPAGMISTSGGAVVEWILTENSAADLPAM